MYRDTSFGNKVIIWAKKQVKMVIKKIKLKNYRNYDDLEIALNEKLNIIIGKNAQGKTNILESIYVLSLTKSYLNINDKNLIKLGNNYSILEAETILNNIPKKFKILINDNGKKVIINGREIKKLSEYISNLKVVIFSPENIRMIRDGPSVRRKFLNMELSQISPLYVRLLMDYNNIIRQKNEYLKLDKINIEYLKILNKKIAELSVNIYIYRKEFIDKLCNFIDNIYYKIMGIQGLRIKYISNIDYFEDKSMMIAKYTEKLEKYLEKEILYKVSLIGPQRDDFIFVLNDKNISLYGSQGQLRSVILSLKLSEIELIKNECNEDPILLLDDIFSELDIEKKNNLINYINDNTQTIITTTDINMIDEKLVKKASIFEINDGKLFPGK